MKQIFAYALIIAIGLNIFSALGIYISFKINQNYIAKYLCIEKDNPESSCHGCCQLEKKLKKNEEQKQENPQSENKKPEIQFFKTSYQIVFIKNSDIQKISIPAPVDTSIILTGSIFRPPKSLA